MMENDKIKNEYCESRNIKLVRIPYYDFDKIENIYYQFIKNIKGMINICIYKNKIE